MIDYKSLIETCDRDIKSGHAPDAIRRLRALDLAQTPREWRLPLAAICRRAGGLTLGLKLLSKVILQDPAMLKMPPTLEERSEYGVLLLRSGCLLEAMGFLSAIDPEKAPEVLLNRSYIHFARWEYGEAIPLLKAYLSKRPSPHAAVVGETNLAFALIENREFETALAILEGVENVESRQLRSTWYALRAQIHISQRDFTAARWELESAAALVGSAANYDQFFVHKLGLILKALETGDASSLEALREQAVSKRYWEAARECDFFSLKIRFEEERFSRLYYGTPFPRFREILENEFSRRPEAGEYRLGPAGAPCLDLRSGKTDDERKLKLGRGAHQLAHALLSDLYRPKRIAGLFSSLFPDDHYDISSSPHRVHQLITRSRQSFAEQGIPLSIHEEKGFYTVQTTGPLAIAIPRERESVELSRQHSSALHKTFENRANFTAEEVMSEMKMSRATVHRLLHRAISDGTVEPAGRQHRAHLYRLKSAS